MAGTTDMGAIRGAPTLLGEPWLEERQRERFLRIIAQNGEGLQRLLENLTALSRLEGNRAGSATCSCGRQRPRWCASSATRPSRAA